jgi:hypothetical protein
MADKLLSLIEQLRLCLEGGDKFYVGPIIDDSKDYYHQHQIDAHQNALSAGAHAFTLSQTKAPAKKRIRAHLKAVEAHKEAAKQLGSFGGSREHIRAADEHMGAIKEIETQLKNGKE